MLYVILCVVFVLIIVLIHINTPRRIEHFTRGFFKQNMKTYFIGIDQSQWSGDFEMIKTIKQLSPFNLEIVMSENRYEDLNNNKIQFIMSRSNEIGNGNGNEIRFVCALYSLPVNIITTNMDLFTFDQFKNSNLVINIGPKQSNDYRIATDLFLAHNMVMGKDIKVTNYNDNDLLDHYGKDVDAVIISRPHPDTTVSFLTNKQLSKMVEIPVINDGNIYHITLDEESFYKSHPYYSKNIMGKSKLLEYYPNLSLNEQVFDINKHEPVSSHKSLFISTISIKYYLLCNTYVPPEEIYQLLYNMKQNMNLINRLPFIEDKLNTASLADFNMPMGIHQGASDFYMSTGLYTNISDPECIMINGRCDSKQLLEHHLKI